MDSRELQLKRIGDIIRKKNAEILAKMEKPVAPIVLPEVTERLVHLHNHSTFSKLDGAGTPKQIAKRAVELGQKAIAITDHGTTYGFISFQDACKAAGIKPIFGVEAYIVEDSTKRTKFQESLGAEGIPHITILARTQEGYGNLVKLVNESYKRFYYRPLIDMDLIAKYQKGLIVTTGCPTGFPTRLIAGGMVEDAHNWIQRLCNCVENVVVEIVAQPGYLPSEIAAPELIRAAIRNKKMLILTGDNHFPDATFADAQHLMTRVGTNNPFRQKANIGIPRYQYICSESELRQRALKMFSANPECQELMRGHENEIITAAIKNTTILADSCEVEITTRSTVFYPDRGETPAATYLRETCMKGFKARIEKGYIPRDRALVEKYVARMNREIAVLVDKNFCDYVSLVGDIAVREKEKGYMVVCRGSAGGCLLLYLMGASETDPIRHDLPFERFFDATRNDPPDIDLDFERGRRDIVVSEIEEKYGTEYVAKIAAFTEYSLKSALLDAARMYEIPRSELEAALSVLADLDDSEESSTSVHSHEVLDALYAKYPHLRVAEKMVGQNRNETIHAAGLIISSSPISETISVYARPEKPRIIATDKFGAARIGLLKADLLAVAALDVTNLARRKAGVSLEQLYHLDLNIPEVYETIEKGMVAGIFQVDGSVMKVQKRAGISNFGELAVASALCRPGAMKYVPEYAENKFSPHWQQKLASFSPSVANIIGRTYLVIAYQEQAMKFAWLAGLPDKEVQALRKVIASSNNEAIDEYCKKLTDGLVNHAKLPQYEAELIVKNIRYHGMYSFNEAHCVTYAELGYRMAWLKTFHPREFYDAYLSLELAADNPDYILVRRLGIEARNAGIIKDAVPLFPTIQEPIRFVGDKIIGGFPGIHGAGKKKGREIAQRFTEKRLTAKMSELSTYLLGISLNASMNEVKNLGSILHWFPWFPTVSPEFAADFGQLYSGLSEFGYNDREYKRRDKVHAPNELVRNMPKYGITVAGYLTAKRRKQRTIAMRHDMYLGFVEDHVGGVEIRITGETPEVYSAYKQSVNRGDFIAVKGNWTGSALIVKEVMQIRPVDSAILSDFEEVIEESNGQ